MNLLCFIRSPGGGVGGTYRDNLSSSFYVTFKREEKTSSLVRFALRAVLLKILFTSFEPFDKQHCFYRPVSS